MFRVKKILKLKIMVLYLKDNINDVGGIIINDKEKLFREYFYSNLTASELKSLLNLNYKEYKELSDRTKKYFNLPSSYRRQPHKYFKYEKDSYYILMINNTDFQILDYYPRKILAEKELGNIDEDMDYIYCIEKATDDNLIHLIEFGYLTLGWNWELLLAKTKLPYSKFYKLLNTVKKLNNCNINRSDRYIYQLPNGEYRVSRTFEGKQSSFGVYENKEFAIRVRDYLESIGWDKELWDECRVKFLLE